jgi:DNA-binding NarL/FixJ family response regulator
LLAGHAVREPLNVLIVTTFDLDEYVYRALRNGACGFLLKDASPALLAEAVRAAAAGNTLISPAVTVRLLAHLAPRRTCEPAEPEAPPSEPLTERELDVVRLVAHGRTNDEIAKTLFVTLATVKTHLANVQRKLPARNRVEIAAWAWRNGVGSTEPPAAGGQSAVDRLGAP